MGRGRDDGRADNRTSVSRSVQAGLELVVAGFLFPSLAVRQGQLAGGCLCRIGDGGDQGDQLAAAVVVGDLVLDDPHPDGLAGAGVLAGAGGCDQLVPGLVVDGGA